MGRRMAENYILKMNRCFEKRQFRRASLYARLLRTVCAMEVQPGTKIDPSVEFVHNGLGCVVHPKTVISANCKIYQNVTLGGNGKLVDGVLTNAGAPFLEEEVAVFAGACVLGPVRIGKGSLIGANAVVTRDVPPNSLVYGNPATIKEKPFEYNFQ